MTLTKEEAENGASVLATAIPGVDDLNECWSNSPDDLHSLESAEVLEEITNLSNQLENIKEILERNNEKSGEIIIGKLES